MNANWIWTTLAIGAGALVGLYIVGKLSRRRNANNRIEPKIKVSGKTIEDLERKLEARKNPQNLVEFERLPTFSYESLVEWINGVDIQDIDKEAANYGCMIVRSSSELNQFNLDLSKLTEDQKNHIFGAMIVNTVNKNVQAQRWIICDNLDEDLLNIFGEDNLKLLK